MFERENAGIIAEHFSNFFLRESCHLIESRIQGIVGSNIETTRQVIHGDRADTCHKDSSQGSVSRSLDGIEELAEIAFTMRLLTITLQVLLVGKDRIGEVVVFIYEEIDFLIDLVTSLA